MQAGKDSPTAGFWPFSSVTPTLMTHSCDLEKGIPTRHSAVQALRCA